MPSPLTSRVEGADVVAGTEAVLRAADVEKAIDVARLIHCRQRAEGDAPRVARHLRPEDRIDDAARVDGGTHRVVAAPASREGENASAFHEERPLLAEEHGEALVHFDLKGVALDLAEVGVDGGIQRDRRGEPDLRAHAEIAAAVGGAPARRRVAQLRAAVGRTRQDLAHEARPDVVEADRRMPLEHPRAGVERRPRDRHARAGDAAPEEHSHARVDSAFEANALQRQSNFSGVARVGQTARAVPDPVGRRILVARHAVQHVELHAAGVDQQMVGKLACPERVEAQPDPVVLPDVVAARDRGLDARGIGVVALEREIEIVGVVGEPHGRLLRNRRSVKRVVRQELTGRQRRPPPRGIVQGAVDDWRLGDALGAKLRAHEFLAINGCRRNHSYCGGQHNKDTKAHRRVGRARLAQGSSRQSQTTNLQFQTRTAFVTWNL